MATHIVADIYACTEHFLVFTNLTTDPNATVSRQLLHYSEIRDFQQFNDGNGTGFTGEIYTVFSNGDQQDPPFNLNNTSSLPTGDLLGINFYPKDALVGATPIVITDNKTFFEAMAMAIGADNAAISF